MENQQIVDYIRSSLAQGKPKEQIYSDLLSNNYLIDEISHAYEIALGAPQAGGSSAQKSAVGVLSVVGAIVIGLGFLLLVASNWQAMDRYVKVLMLLFLMVVFYMAGWFLKEKTSFAKSGQALFLLGAIVYGGSIFLTAQIFNLRLLWPDGFILWMIGVLLMARALEYDHLYILAGITGFIAVSSHPFFFLIPDLRMTNDFFMTSTWFIILALGFVVWTARHFYKKDEFKNKGYF